MGEANHSRTVASVPRPPAPKYTAPTPIPSPLEKGVNTLAACWRTGHGDPVLLWFASLLGMQIKVGRWSLCPVLQHPTIKPLPQPLPLWRGVNTLASCWRTGHGGHRPTMVCNAIHSPLPFYAFLTKKYFFGNVCSTYHSIFAPEIRKEKPS